VSNIPPVIAGSAATTAGPGRVRGVFFFADVLRGPPVFLVPVFFAPRDDFFARVVFRAAADLPRAERAVFFDLRDAALRFDAVRFLAARFFGLMLLSSHELLIAIDDCGLSPIAGMVIGRSLLNRRLDNRQSTTVYTRSISNLHWTAMRSQTRTLYSLLLRIAVLGARSAPSKYSQPA
jgi:hypothetical protein